MFKASIIILLLASFMVLSNSSPVKRQSENDELDAKVHKLTAVYKVLRTYLELQIDELDKSFMNDFEGSAKQDREDVLPFKRYLKKQSFMDKFRNKMHNDLSLYGYDKK